jgi:hypothetical protein
MQNVNITFTENGWWLPGGFIALLVFAGAFVVQTWKVRRSPAVWFLVVAIIFWIWMLDYYANATFGSFTRLERQGSVIRFYYYFGRPHEFQWTDVQKIVSEPAHKGASDVRFVMRDGTEIRSYETTDKATITRALSLSSEIHDVPPNK